MFRTRSLVFVVVVVALSMSFLSFSASRRDVHRQRERFRDATSTLTIDDVVHEEHRVPYQRHRRRRPVVSNFGDMLPKNEDDEKDEEEPRNEKEMVTVAGLDDQGRSHRRRRRRWLPLGAWSGGRNEGGYRGEEAGTTRRPSSSIPNERDASFDALLDALLDGTVISVPDRTLTRRVPFMGTVSLSIRGTTCFGLSLDKVEAFRESSSSSLLSDERHYDIVAVEGVDATCVSEWIYDSSKGTTTRRGGGVPGTVRVVTENNDVRVRAIVRSKDFSRWPPFAVEGRPCDDGDVTINVKDMDFRGGKRLTTFLANLFERNFRDGVEDTVRDLLCRESVTAFDGVRDLIRNASETIVSYWNNEEDNADPLAGEADLVVPKGVRLLNFSVVENDHDDGFNNDLNWLVKRVNDVVEYLGGMVDNGVREGDPYLVVNRLFHDGRVVITSDGRALHQGAGPLTEFAVELNEWSVRGLDTFTRFGPLRTIGSRTLRSTAAWTRLTVTVNLTLTLRPSSGEESIVVDSENREVVENVSVTMDFDDVEVDSSILLAVDQNLLGNLTLGSLLLTESYHQTLRCVSSAVRTFNITKLKSSVSTVGRPRVLGSGMERILSGTAHAFHDMYAASVVIAIPTFFAKEAKYRWNDATRTYLDNKTNVECFEPFIMGSKQESIDFRDLLLDPNKSLLLGGSGMSPYGNVLPKVKKLVDSFFLNRTNVWIRMIVQLWTNNGTIVFPDLHNVLNLSVPSIGLDVTTYHVSVEYTDRLSRVPVFSLFEPTDADPHVLSHRIHIQSLEPDHLLRLNVGLSFVDETYGFHENIHVRIDIGEFDVRSKTVLGIDTNSMSHFPLRDLVDWNCWATMISPIASSAHTDASYRASIQNLTFSHATTKIDITANCVFCTTVGTRELATMVSTLRRIGIWKGISTRALRLLEEIATGDDVQRWLDRWIKNARRSCPHDSSYDSLTGRESETLDLFSLESFSSRESLETVLLFAGVAAQLGSTIAALNIISAPFKNKTAHLQDPLFGDVADDRLVDLKEWNNTMVVRLLNDVWFGGDPITTANSTVDSVPYETIGVNRLVQIFLLDEHGTYHVSLDVENFSFAGHNFAVSSIKFHGLDTFSTARVFDVTSSRTFRSTFALDDVRVEIRIAADTFEQEDIIVIVGFEGVTFTIDVSLVIDKEKLGDVRLGSLFRTESILPCFASTVRSLRVTEVDMLVTRVKEPVITGFLSEETGELLAKSAIELLDAYKSNITAAVRTMFRDRINNSATRLLGTNAICHKFRSDDDDDDALTRSSFVDFRDLLLSPDAASAIGGRGDEPYGDSVWKAWNVTHDRLMSPNNANGVPRLNDMLSKALFAEKKWSVVSDSYLSRTNDDHHDREDRTRFKIHNVTFRNINSVGYPTYFLTPRQSDPHTLENTLTVGARDAFLVDSNIFVGITEGGLQVENEVLVSLAFDLTSLLFSIRALVNTNALFEFPLRHIRNPNCWLSTVPAPMLNEIGVPSLLNINSTIVVDSFRLLFEDVRLNVTCVKCTSPNMESLSALGALVKNPTLLSNALEKLFKSKAVKDWVGRNQYNASIECPFNAGYIVGEPPKSNVTSVFDAEEFVDDSYLEIVGFAATGLGLLLTVLIVKRLIKRRAAKDLHNWLVTLTEEELWVIRREQIWKEEEERRLCVVTKSMLTSEVVPIGFRFLMPFIIVGNIALFVSGHINIGATLTVEGQIAGQNVSLPNFLSFSIAKSTFDMWNAGSRELALIIAVFSGLWPYTKQLVTLVLLCVSPTKVSTSRRGSVLRWLDSLGKWSMLDIYMLVLSLISFRLTIVSPSSGLLLPKDFYKIETLVVPVWGLYANMIAQIVSQVSSHFVLHYHDKIVVDGKLKVAAARSAGSCRESVNQESQKNDFSKDKTSVTDVAKKLDSKSSLCGHSYKLGGTRTGRVSKVSRGANIFVGAISVVAILCLLIGCVCQSLKQELLGILGIIIEAGNAFEEAVYKYSFFDIVQLLIGEALFVNTSGQYVGLGTLTILFIFSTLLVPIFLFLILLGLWFVPMKKKKRLQFLTIVDLLGAWQYLEVYIISLLLASWQLGRVSEYLLNERYCIEFGDAFDLLTYYGVVSQSDAQCFYNKINVAESVYLLSFSAIILAWLTDFVTKAAAQKHEDTESSSWSQKDNDIVSLDDTITTEDDCLLPSLQGVKPAPHKFSDSFSYVLIQYTEARKL